MNNFPGNVDVLWETWLQVLQVSEQHMQRPDGPILFICGMRGREYGQASEVSETYQEH